MNNLWKYDCCCRGPGSSRGLIAGNHPAESGNAAGVAPGSGDLVLSDLPWGQAPAAA